MAFFSPRTLIRFIAKNAYSRFEKACRSSVSLGNRQDKRWRKIRTLLQDSGFWKERLGNSGLPESLEDFPLTDYETYRGVLEQDFEHETRSSLTGEKVLFWCESSGSTGKRKVFPVTRSYQREFQLTTLPLLASLFSRFSGFLRKPVLYFAANHPSLCSGTGLEVGFISNFNYRNIPRLLKSGYAFPYEVFENSDTFSKWGPLYAVASDLSGIFAIAPSMLIQFLSTIEKERERILQALEDPSLIPTHLPKPRVSSARRATIRRAFSGSELRMKDLWPSMEFICCWTGSTCGLQLPLLEPYAQGISIVDATYSATEGWMTVPKDTGKIGGPFQPLGHVLEFLPPDLESPTKNDLLKPWQLVTGQEYEVVLTTSMGFVRYRLYDVVRCNGFFHSSPILEFRRKAGRLISLGQTRVNEAHLFQAQAEARDRTGVSLLGHWVVGPGEFGNQLVLYLEKDQEEVAQALLGEMDRNLCRLNEEYADDIKAGLLKPLCSRYLGPAHELWSRWPRHAQAKPTHLIQDVLP